MKTLALLIGLFIAHHRPEIARWRRLDWLGSAARLGSGRDLDWLPTACVIGIALLLGVAVTALADGLGGKFGVLLAGIAAVLYTIGPRDLDLDLAAATDVANLPRRQTALEHLGLQPGDDGIRGLAAVLHAALARWFGVVFWFTILGIPGALAYRAVREAFHHPELGIGERHVLGRTLAWINWPVVLLMIAAIGLMNDFDRVRATFAARADRWQLPAALLDDLAAALGSSEASLAEGLDQGRALIWRILWLWLVVQSLMLLIGLID